VLEDDLTETVRRLISARQAKELLNQIKEWDGEASSQWKARADNNQAAIDGGDPFEYGKVFKGLSKLEAENSLRARDRAHLNRSLDFLTQELAHSLGKSTDQARRLISKTLG